MKTAISVDDDLLNRADRLAREIGVSRSKLISNALQAFLKQREQQEMLEQLNRVYGGKEESNEKRMAPLYKVSFARTIRDKW